MRLYDVWIETKIERRWFGLLRREVYYVRTDFSEMRFEDRRSAEYVAGVLARYSLQ